MHENKQHSSSTRGLVHNLSFSFLANLVSLFSSLIIVAVATRHFQKAELGFFFLIMVITLFASAIGDFGLRNSTIKTLAGKEKLELLSSVRYFLTLNAIGAFAISIAIALATPRISDLTNTEHFLHEAWWAAPVAFFTMKWQMIVSVLIGLSRLREVSRLTFVVELSRTIISLGGILCGRDIDILLIAIVVSRAFGILAFYFSNPDYLRPTFRVSGEREIWAFSGWVYGSNILSITAGKISDLFLNHLMGTAGLATYSTAMQIPLVINRGFESARPVILGYISSLKGGRDSALENGARIVSGSLAISSIAIIFACPVLVPLLFSTNYIDSIPVLAALTLWVTAGLTNYYVSTALLGEGRGQSVFLYSLLQLPVMTLCCSFLIPLLGPVGGAYALLLTALFGTFAYSYMLRRVYPGLSERLARQTVMSVLPSFLYASISSSLTLSALSNFLLAAAALLALRLLDVARFSEFASLARHIRLSLRESW